MANRLAEYQPNPNGLSFSCSDLLWTPDTAGNATEGLEERWGVVEWNKVGEQGEGMWADAQIGSIIRLI